MVSFTFKLKFLKKGVPELMTFSSGLRFFFLFCKVVSFSQNSLIFERFFFIC